MGIFSRMNDIVQSNINVMLDKAEDPHKVLRLLIQEMEETRNQLRLISAKNLAEQKTLTRRITQLEKVAHSWTEKAELALSKDKEALAKSALIEKQKVEGEIEHIQGNLAIIADNLAKLSDDASKLNAKLTEAQHKQKSFAQREQTGVIRLKATQTNARHDIAAAMEKFERYESKVEALEAKVDAYEVVPSAASVDAQFAAMERDDKIEAELAELKQRLAERAKQHA